MRKLYNVLKGWFIFIFYKRSELANQRLKICFRCPYRFAVVCEICGCELHAKASLDDEECPKGFWKAVPEIDKLDIPWP